MTASRIRCSRPVELVIGPSLKNRAAFLGPGDVVPVEVELQQDLLRMLSVFGSARRRRWWLVELHWCGDDLVLVAVRVEIADDIAVRSDLRIMQSFLRRRQGRPHARFVLERGTPVLQVLAGKRFGDERARLGGIGNQIARRDKPWVGGELRESDSLA